MLSYPSFTWFCTRGFIYLPKPTDFLCTLKREYLVCHKKCYMKMSEPGGRMKRSSIFSVFVFVYCILKLLLTDWIINTALFWCKVYLSTYRWAFQDTFYGKVLQQWQDCQLDLRLKTRDKKWSIYLWYVTMISHMILKYPFKSLFIYQLNT